MTSFECSEINVPDFNHLFTIQGQVYYHIVSLFPPAGKTQILPDLFYGQYSLSGSYVQGATFYDGLLPGIVWTICQVLSKSNHYVHIFKTAKEIFDNRIILTSKYQSGN